MDALNDSLVDIDIDAAKRRIMGDALALLPMVVEKMTAILDDPRATATAKVQAARTIGEIAGAVGRERQPKTPLALKPVNEMTHDELVTAARRADDALRRLGPKLAVDNTADDPLA